MDRLDSGDIQLIDVREPKELEKVGKIPQATNIPRESEGRIKQFFLSLITALDRYCRMKK